MWRVLTEPVAFFLAPFLLYVIYLVALRRHPLEPVHWPNRAVMLLTIAGLVTAVAGVLFFGLTANRETGAYVPAHVEDGRVVPGHFK